MELNLQPAPFGSLLATLNQINPSPGDCLKDLPGHSELFVVSLRDCLTKLIF